MKRILLVDGNGLVYRAYYATAYANVNTLRAIDGTPTNALLGFITMLEKILKEEYDYVLVALDKASKNFRYEMLPSYKEKRSKTPLELLTQLPLIREFLDAYGIRWYEHDDYEADDIIATITQLANQQNIAVDILSSDGDLEQLLNEQTKIIKPKQGMSQVEIVNVKTLEDRWNLTPQQIPDLKGLKGDASDNLAGIKGVGEKTAVSLLHRFGTLENVIKHVDELKGQLKENIKREAKIGLLSKDLATLRYDVPFECNFDQLVVKTNWSKLKQFYLKYNIKSLANRLNIEETDQEDNKGQIITKWEANYNDKNNTLFVEIDQENYHRANIIGFAIVNNKGSFYIPYDSAVKDNSFLEFLNNGQYLKDTFDLKKTINVCRWHNIDIKGIDFDLQLASYVLNANMKTTIDNVITYFTNQNFTNDIEFYKKYPINELDMKSIASFVTNKAIWITNLKTVAINKLQLSKQWSLYQDIEFPCAFILAKMEFQGIKVDLDQLEVLSSQVFLQVQTLNQEINTLAGQEVNPNSPKQLKELLFDKLGLLDLKKGSTAQEVLLLLSTKQPHLIIEKIIEYRKYQKTYSTYLKGLEKFIFSDNKVHTIYKQTNTTTGRLSSQEPNMQNISIHDEEQKLVRKVFVLDNPQEQVILSSDYSQIELKILAHIANVKALITAFNNEEDIHTLTASKIFNINKSEVTEKQRRIAKTVNFGIIYGISDFGLSKQLMIPIYEAKQFIDRYFAVFPEIRNYMEETIKYCEQNGYVKTLFNRVRYIPTINDRNKIAKEAAQRTAINAPIQGTAADVMKIALINIDQQLQANKLQSYLVAQVHDELILEVYKQELELVKRIVIECMQSAMTLTVPLNVDIATGTNWYEV